MNDFIKLNEVCIKITDGSHYSPIEDINGEYPMLSVKDMFEYGFKYDDCKFINQIDYEKLVKSDCKPKYNDVLIAKDGSYLKHVFVIKNEIEQAILSSIGILRPNLKKIVPEYLKYFLHSPFVKNEVAKKYVSGSALPRIILKNFGEIEIINKPILEQQKIANVLSFLDSKIELNNKINQELEAMAKILYDYWFVQFDFPNENGKPYKSSGGKMVYNQELKRDIPNGWEVVILDKIVNILNGYAFKSEDYIQNGIFVLRTKNFNEENITEFLHDDVYLPNDFKEKYDSYLCQAFDYHLVMVGASVGKTGMIYSHQLPALRNQNMWCFRAKKNSPISRGYLKYLVDSLVLEFSTHATGSARQFYTKDNFKKHPVILPSIETLQEFANVHNPILKKQANIQQQNQELAKLRDWLLPMLMNGQVRVK